MKNYFKSLKSKILFYCFAFTIIILFIMIFICLITFNNFAKLNTIQTTNYNLQIAMDNIDTNVSAVMNIAHWASTNNYVSTFISSNDTYTTDLKFKKLAAQNALKNHMYSLGVDHYINKAIIYSEKGNSIQFGSSYGDRSDVQACISFPFFNKLKNTDKIEWIGIFDEPFYNSNQKKAIPIIQKISTNYQQAPLGWIYISMNTNIITDFLVPYDFDKNSTLYLKIGNKLYDISDRKNFIEVDTTLCDLIEHNYKKYKNSTYIEWNDKVGSHTAVFYTSNILGWTLIQTLSNNHFIIKNKIYINFLFLVTSGILLLVILIVFTMNQIITHPIQNILKQINRISLGDFSYNPSIESDNEIGYIGIGINKMSQDIQKLITNKIEFEKKQKNLELKMLQNQINPHFLYNTLNTIQWMAMIQKSTGITEIVSALANLLKNLSKGTDELISLQEEIDLLNEYCTIQQYRYAGLFTIHYYFEDPLLKKCKIIKFTLQPIVENAIFHGIDPKGTTGHIHICVTKPSKNLLQISIKDDGVGMTQNQIKMLMNGCIVNKKQFNSIGIKNVDERIKLTFGDNYGITIHSILKEYTEVIITLPFKLKNQE
ncbi:MAG: histidine kinase [Epulopiscium sp.]|nr:histidine kinase [Candidatus Epulonipiscium sp.]